MRLATSEAAEQRACARLLAAEQRGHALGEQCRRLHARLGRTEVDLVGPSQCACCPPQLLTAAFHAELLWHDALLCHTCDEDTTIF